MNKKNETLVEIIRICLSIDSRAYTIYTMFASNCSDRELAREWKACAADEKVHMAFWEKALELAKCGELPQIFEAPEEIKSTMLSTEEKIDKLVSNLKSCKNSSDTLTVAYRLESFMLDSAFITMFHFFDSINRKIENNYEEHINRFIEILRKYAGTSPHLEMLGKALGKLFRQNRDLVRQNSIDPLTGILNRRGFFSSVRPFLNLAKRKNMLVSIIMCDIDNFNKVNDTHGHQVGDKAIAAVASIIGDKIRRSDIAGRYGGEEFIVFLTIKDEQSLKSVCERIRSTVEEKSGKMSGVDFTISLGAASGEICDNDERDLSLIIARADENLMEAKRTGKNRWIISS